MNNLHERLQQVRLEIAEAERRFGREPGSVKLLAVSKTRAAGDVLALAQLGVSDFGENYVQEARTKIGQLSGQSLTWHFIGPIQSNKTHQVAEHFDWVHSRGPHKGGPAIKRGAARAPASPEYLHTGQR